MLSVCSRHAGRNRGPEVIADPTRRESLMPSATATGRWAAGRDGRDASARCVSSSQGVAHAGWSRSGRDAQRRLYRLRPEPLMELDACLEPYRADGTARLDSARAAPATHTKTNPPEFKGTPMSYCTDTPTMRLGAHRRGAIIRFERHLPTRLATSGTRSRSGAIGRLVAAVRRRHHRRPPRGANGVAGRGDEPVR